MLTAQPWPFLPFVLVSVMRFSTQPRAFLAQASSPVSR